MITVGFLSDQGFLIAATDETLAQALSQLEDQTGIPAKDGYADARGYLQFRYGVSDGVGGPTARLSESATVSGTQRELQPDTTNQDAPKAQTDDAEGGEATHTQQPGGQTTGDGVDAVCVMCAAAVKPALAEMARERWGQVLCRGCGNW